MNDRDDINNIPFLKIVPLIVTAIVVCNLITIPVSIPITVALVSMVICLMRPDKIIGTVVASVLIFSCTAVMTNLRSTHEILPKREKILLSVSVENNPITKGRWQQCSAVAEGFHEHESSEWQATREKLIVNIDTCMKISAGDRLVVSAYMNPISSDPNSGYARLMRRRGYTTQCYVSSSSAAIKLPEKANSLKILSARIQKFACERFDKLILSDDTKATCMAMTFGDKRELNSELKEKYAISGAAHLLAVSGLHVGIVAMLINILLSFIPLLRYGHIIKNVVAIIMILLYAMATGLSASVIRAAIMFCGYQISLATSQKGNRINIMLATAAIMLLINPNNLYDISFQLSFAAVFGIMILYAPLYKYFKCSYKPLNWLSRIVIIGIIATLFTAPIVSAQFGRISILGIFINPLLLLTANIIILSSLIFTIIPSDILVDLTEHILEFIANFQNDIIAFGNDIRWSSIDGKMPNWCAIAIYLLFFICLMAYNTVKNRKDEKITLPKS